MKTRVGIAIAHDAIRAVVVRGREMRWAREVEREPGTPSPEMILALLADAPLRPRPAATVVVGPHASQVKKLAGLPPVDDTDTLSAMIRENVSAFFVGCGAGLRTTGVRPVGQGMAWAGAIDASYVDSARQGCRSSRVRLAAIAPCAVALPLAIRDERFRRTDGPVTLEVEVSNGEIASVRKVPSPPEGRLVPLEMVDELASLEERAERFADAYGAAIAPIGDPLTLGPAGDVPWDRRRRMRRILPPAFFAAAAAAALLLSPLIPWFAARGAESRLRAIQASEEWRLTLDVRSQLQRATAVLAEIESFSATRPNRTRLLAALARELPDATAIERFDATDDEVRLIAVAPEAASVIEAIAALPGVGSVTRVGGTARVHMGGRALERFTVTFEHTSSVPAEPAAATAQ